MSGSTPDPYAVLGVPPTATAQEITRAYRRLLRSHHPDTGTAGRTGSPRPTTRWRWTGCGRRTRLLRDPAARAEHDRTSRARPSRGRRPPPRPPRRTMHVTVVAPRVTVAPHVTVVAPERDVPAQPDIRVGPVLWRPPADRVVRSGPTR